MQAVKIQQFFEKNLLYFIALSMIGGAAFGLYFPQYAPKLKPLVPVTLFLMLYPMMIGMQVEQVAAASKNARVITCAVFLNFIVSPLLGFLVARSLLGHLPPFAVALILLSATPCAGMVVGWTGMAKGNVPLALVIVTLSLLLSIVTIPVTMLFLAGTIVKINAMDLFRGTLLVILAPLVLGDLTRRFIIRQWGNEGFTSLRPLLPPASMTGMFAIIFISLALGADKIIPQAKSIFIILAAIILFYTIQIAVSIWISKLMKLQGEDGIALVYSVVGKNVSLAVGLASQFFSPLSVAMLAINPLIQAPAMAWFLRWSPRMKGK